MLYYFWLICVLIPAYMKDQILPTSFDQTKVFKECPCKHLQNYFKWVRDSTFAVQTLYVWHLEKDFRFHNSCRITLNFQPGSHNQMWGTFCGREDGDQRTGRQGSKLEQSQWAGSRVHECDAVHVQSTESWRVCQSENDSYRDFESNKDWFVWLGHFFTKECLFISFPVAEKVIYMQRLQQTASQPEKQPSSFHPHSTVVLSYFHQGNLSFISNSKWCSWKCSITLALKTTWF